jgi:hypothetical protein
MAYRPKLGFGQPIFEWMRPGGQLRPLIDGIGRYDFVDPAAFAQSHSRPGWFLYSLLCFDIWYRAFIPGDGRAIEADLSPFRLCLPRTSTDG